MLFHPPHHHERHIIRALVIAPGQHIRQNRVPHGGKSRWNVYWNIILPLSRPAVVAVGLFTLVGLWNEFIMALTLISSEAKRPLTLAIWNFQGQFSADIPAMMSALLLSSLPLLALYAIFKEKLIEGLTAGAIKG